MILEQDFVSQGNWLFRYRGVIPYIVLPLMALALFKSGPDAWMDAEPHETIWQIFCVALSVLGILVRILVIGYVPSGTSGRNTTEQRASQVNQVGMYSLVRHPLYLGNFLTALGLALSIKVAWFALAFSLIYALYYERIMLAEESFMRGKFGAEYDAWAAHTPAFFPRHLRWSKPELPFSWRIVLRREYPGLIVTAAGFYILDWLEECVVEHEHTHPDFLDAFVFVLFLAGVLRLLKKKTTLLQTPDR